jgi:hypothetical protein
VNEDRFERDLRAVIAEPASGAVPASLGQWLTALPEAEAVRGRTRLGRLFDRRGGGDRRARTVAWVGTAAAVLAVIVIGGTLWTSGGGQTGAGAGSSGTPTAGPTVSPATGPSVPARFAWDSGVVSLSMADGAIIANGQQFLVEPGVIDVHSDAGDATYQTLELTWHERGVEMRLNIYFAADATSWWASEIRTYDGAANGDWIYYKGPFFRTPRGQPYIGDISLASPGGTGGIKFGGVQLEAFRPGRVRNGPQGCRRVVGPGMDGADPLAPDSPLAGSGLGAMTPQAAAAWLDGHGYCVSWRFEYRTGPNQGYSEYWCTPPPATRIRQLLYDGDGNLIIFTEPLENTIRPQRPQPAIGWGC